MRLFSRSDTSPATILKPLTRTYYCQMILSHCITPVTSFSSSSACKIQSLTLSYQLAYSFHPPLPSPCQYLMSPPPPVHLLCVCGGGGGVIIRSVNNTRFCVESRLINGGIVLRAWFRASVCFILFYFVADPTKQNMDNKQ